MQNVPASAIAPNGDNNVAVGKSAPAATADVDAEAVEQDQKDTNGSLYPHLRADGNGLGSSSCDMQQQQPGGIAGGADNSNMFVQHKMVPIPQSSYNILRARRGVIRMLIVVVLTFAICNLPFHARKIWQYW